MCGIAGFWTNWLLEDTKSVADRMGDAIQHRGPDSSSIWEDKTAGLTLIHRRLAVVDVSPAGKQPMVSECGRYVICYNGEIYNYREIRADLESKGHTSWRGHSDTEVLLALIARDGMHAALQQCIGMFAISLWDRSERKLVLARDRLGEKPIYYGHQGGSFLFASELKALRAHPHWEGEIDRNNITLLMRHNYIGTPHCIFRSIWKLLPGHYIEVQEGGRLLSEPICYWSIEESVQRGQRQPLFLGDKDATDALEQLLLDAVALQMQADVPLGAFLSGGIDSTTIVALMRARSSQPVRTFSIGFEQQAYNEAHYAKKVAAHLGTDHTELYVSSKEAMEVIPELPLIYDEPFADSSQIPMFLVSALAKKHVKVSLSGDGGDELFGGYNRYTLGYGLWRKLSRLPVSIRHALHIALPRIPSCVLNRASTLSPKEWRPFLTSDRLEKLGAVMKHQTGEEFYRSLVSHFQWPEKLVLHSHEPRTVLTDPTAWPPVGILHERMMYLDTKTYLPDDILVKVDRAAMAVGLETRVPFLDHRVVEFSHRMPLSMKIRDGQRKWLLRQVLDRHVPRALTDRPKMGFGVPIGDWLRHSLRDWAEDLLDEARLRRDGYFDAGQVRRTWQDHLSGRRQLPHHLWNVLMFQAWLDKHRSY